MPALLATEEGKRNRALSFIQLNEARAGNPERTEIYFYDKK